MRTMVMTIIDYTYEWLNMQRLGVLSIRKVVVIVEVHLCPTKCV